MTSNKRIKAWTLSDCLQFPINNSQSLQYFQMQNKKFVRSQMFQPQKYGEKTDKYPKTTSIPPQRPKKHNREYAEKPDHIDLRKYYQIAPASALPQLQELITRFPNFFFEASTNYQPSYSRYQGRSQNVIVPIEVQEEEICSWDTDGEVELGVGIIDKSKHKKFEGTAPLKINQLKRHERDFLEDELRIKEKNADKEELQKQVIKKEPQVVQLAPKNPIIAKQPPTKAVSQSQSDDEIQIVKTTQYQTRPQQPAMEIHESSSEEELEIKTQSEGQSSKFKDSQASEDIFGDDEDEDNNAESKHSEDSAQKIPNAKGSVEFAKGQFGIFALSQGLKPSDEVWTISNGPATSKKFSSSEMDKDYRKVYSAEYPLIGFDKYPACVNYLNFTHHPSIELFIPQSNTGYEQKFHNGRRKYSNHQPEGNRPQRNRRQSNAQYKAKENEYV